MRGSHELMVGNDAPTPSVLFQLQAQGMVAGKEHKRLRMRPGGRKLVLPTEIVIPEDQEALRDRRYEQVWCCLVDKKDIPRAWTMHMISRYHIIELNKGIGSVVVTYSFGWDRTQTTMANKQIAIAPVPERDIADDVDHFAVADDMATRWEWETELTQVTQGDALLLLEDLERFSGRILPSQTHTNRAAET